LELCWHPLQLFFFCLSLVVVVAIGGECIARKGRTVEKQVKAVQKQPKAVE
jgi:hypothetical protein